MLSRFFNSFLGAGKRAFDSLSEQEILALAISSEEEDARIYKAYADGLRDAYPASASVFDTMADEEHEHRRRLIEAHQERFGETVPLIRREHVRGFYDLDLRPQTSYTTAHHHQQPGVPCAVCRAWYRARAQIPQVWTCVLCSLTLTLTDVRRTRVKLPYTGKLIKKSPKPLKPEVCRLAARLPKCRSSFIISHLERRKTAY